MLRPRQSTRVLLAFGLSLGMYGIRLLAEQRSVRSAFPLATVQWRYLSAFLTYLVNIPLAFFIARIIGPGWRNSTRSVGYMVAAFAQWWRSALMSFSDGLGQRCLPTAGWS